MTIKRAFVFPGQGSQSVAMGKEVYDNFAVAKEVFQEVDEALQQKLSKVIFEGPIEDLTLTENTQPALMATSIAVLRVLLKEAKLKIEDIASFVAGHSLGEYTALCAAGSISLSDTAKLLRIRGNAMQQAVAPGKGGMAALIGVDFAKAQEIANLAGSNGDCQAANDNGGGQVVISGTMAAIDEAVKIAAEHGVKRAIKLPVSAPFHSKLMQPAARVMAEALAGAKIVKPVVPLIANVSAQEETDPDTIRQLLVDQVTGMVRWRESVIALKAKGIQQLVEVGAGKVLAGLTKRIDAELEAVSIGNPADIENFLKNM